MLRGMLGDGGDRGHPRELASVSGTETRLGQRVLWGRHRTQESQPGAAERWGEGWGGGRVGVRFSAWTLGGRPAGSS